jgi:hypothetical protein
MSHAQFLEDFVHDGAHADGTSVVPTGPYEIIFALFVYFYRK